MRGAGHWGLRRSQTVYAGFGLVLKGTCWLTVDDREPVRLNTGDFVLMPAGLNITIASDPDSKVVPLDEIQGTACRNIEAWYGDKELEANFEQLGGYFELDAANQDLLRGLLPTLVHIEATDPAATRLKHTTDLIVDEALSDRPARELIVDRLIEVLLVKAIRHCNERMSTVTPAGLLSGLADPHLARALRKMHGDVAHAWSVEELAKEAGLSRSAFSTRFGQRVGSSPMRYLINWRMALAKSMLKRGASSLEVVAAEIGYQSASAFSTSFRREIGVSPSQFVRNAMG